nr:MAG TPA: hypothetical protein [Caudoviricetes sp.]
MNNHGYVSTMRASCVDVDSYNRVGIYSAGDLDNGVFVTLGAIEKGVGNVISAFNYAVTPASADTTGSVWLVNTPEVGTDIEMQMMSDPRYFYNKAGRPMSLKYLAPKVDIIEADANCFASGALPTTEGYVTIGANGKLVAAAAAATGGNPYFSVVGFNEVAVGMGVMKTVVLQCEAN